MLSPPQARLPAGSGSRLGIGQGLHLAAQVVSSGSLAVSRLCCRGKQLSSPLLNYACSLLREHFLTLLRPQPPHMPRLGLLAVANSSSMVQIFSVPHPDALHATREQDNSGETGVHSFLIILIEKAYVSGCAMLSFHH